jgi:hypothetical protein
MSSSFLLSPHLFDFGFPFPSLAQGWEFLGINEFQRLPPFCSSSAFGEVLLEASAKVRGTAGINSAPFRPSGGRPKASIDLFLL